MDADRIINQAIIELKRWNRPFMLVKEFTFMSGLNHGDDEYLKIYDLLIKSPPFERHGDFSVKFSREGLTIANDFTDWYAYKNSLKPRTDYAKWIAVFIALTSLVWNIFQGISNNRLEKENRLLIEKLDKYK